MKKIAFWAVTIFAPFLILLIIELGLRLGGYNEDARDLFIEFPGQPNNLVANPDFAQRYFPGFSPKIDISPFRKTKSDSAFRVFVLGGSSTEGFPYNSYLGFSEHLKKKLLLESKGLEIEVINLGMTAVNSYVIWDLSRRLSAYHPDAIVIYAGHNEYYGSFGVGSTQFDLGNNVYIKRIILRLKDVALFQVLEGLFAPDNKRSGNRTIMAEVIKESDIRYQSDLYEAGIQQFESNISHVLRYFGEHDIPVYIGTLTSNLKDQPPLGDEEKALTAYETGKQYLENGQADSAKKAYLRAKELDGTRFRAPLALNNSIIKLADKHGAQTVDVYTASFDSSVSGIPDNSFFDDHLHPNFRAHQIIGELFFEKMKTHPVIAKHYLPNTLSKRLPVNQFEKTYAEVQILKLISGYPFKKGLTEQEEQLNFQNSFNQYIRRSYIDSMAAVTWKNREPVPLALVSIVKKLSEEDDPELMARYYLSLVHWPLINAEWLKQGIDAIMRNRELDAYSASLLHYVVYDSNQDPFFLNAITALYLINRDTARGKFWLDKLEQKVPDTPDVYHNYARYHAVKGEIRLSNQYYQKYLNARKGVSSTER